MLFIDAYNHCMGYTCPGFAYDDFNDIDSPVYKALKQKLETPID